jgi:hypothetical protein
MQEALKGKTLLPLGWFDTLNTLTFILAEG